MPKKKQAAKKVIKSRATIYRRYKEISENLKKDNLGDFERVANEIIKSTLSWVLRPRMPDPTILPELISPTWDIMLKHILADIRRIGLDAKRKDTVFGPDTSRLDIDLGQDREIIPKLDGTGDVSPESPGTSEGPAETGTSGT